MVLGDVEVVGGNCFFFGLCFVFLGGRRVLSLFKRVLFLGNDRFFEVLFIGCVLVYLF